MEQGSKATGAEQLEQGEQSDCSSGSGVTGVEGAERLVQGEQSEWSMGVERLEYEE
jgi:hypothetical protein